MSQIKMTAGSPLQLGIKMIGLSVMLLLLLVVPKGVQAAHGGTHTTAASYYCAGSQNNVPPTVQRGNIFGEVIIFSCSEGTIQRGTSDSSRSYTIACTSGPPENPLPHIWNCPNRAEVPQIGSLSVGDGSDEDTTLRCDSGEEGVQLSNPIDVNGDGVPDECVPFDEDSDDLAQNPIIKFLGVILNFVLGGVGLVIIAVLIFAGYRYMTSDGNPQAVSQAKKMIFLAVSALIGFFFAAALINWLIPGGIL